MIMEIISQKKNWEKFDAVNIVFVNSGAIYQVRVDNEDYDAALEKAARRFNKLSKLQ